MKGPNGVMLALVIGIMMAVSYGPRLFEKGTYTPPNLPEISIPTIKPPQKTNPDLLAKPLTQAGRQEAVVQLNSLTVARDLYADDYDRKLFPHWRVTSGPCDGRRSALKRYGVNVVSNGCDITSGDWHDPYTGQVFHSPSEIEADHIVALKEAWRSGAKNWTTAKRQQFANDDKLVVLMTKASVNRSKSDEDPSDWQPPLRSYWPQYAKRWIQIKKTYGLTIDPAEKRALEKMLAA